MSCLEKQTPQKVFLELHTRKSVIWKDLQSGEKQERRPSSNLWGESTCVFHGGTVPFKLQYFSQIQGHLSSPSWVVNCTRFTLAVALWGQQQSWVRGWASNSPDTEGLHSGCRKNPEHVLLRIQQHPVTRDFCCS